jgi:hypothetical protein
MPEETKDLATKGPTGLANWEQKLAEAAVVENASEAMPGGQFIKTRGGFFKIGDQLVKDNKLNVSVLAHRYENAWYSDKFDPDNPKPPDCFALGTDEEEMRPHEKSTLPQGGPDGRCATCPKNKWNSDPEGGKGKACKNVRRLAILSSDGMTPDSIKNGEVLYIKPPVMSVKFWSTYLKTITNVLKRPLWSVATQIGARPDPKATYVLTFQHLGNINEPALLSALEARKAEVETQIEFPYLPMEKSEEVPDTEPAKPLKGQ